MQALDNASRQKSTGQIMVYFLLLAIGLAFVPFLVLLVKAKPGAHFSLPAEFALSTLLIIGSCRAIHQVKVYLLNDKYRQSKLLFKMLSLLGALFLLLQGAGWNKLMTQWNRATRNIVLVLIFIHALHFAIAIVLAIVMRIKTNGIKSGTDVYIFFLDHKNKSFFSLSFLYWEFLSFVWIVLYVIILLRCNVLAD